MTGPAAVMQTTRTGQLRLAVPEAQRLRHATGQQELCAACLVAGVDRLGVSRDGPGSPPLCRSCWRGREQRRARAERWEGVGAAEAAMACPVCGPAGEQPEAEPTAPASGDQRVRQGFASTRYGCWWCGDRAWLTNLRWRFKQDQAAAAAAEAARVDAEFERIAAITEAEATVADLTGWIERLRTILARYEAGTGGRAVELTADALARLAAARTSARGRPSVVPRLVAGVLAGDSDWRSGRRGLPGRERTAWLIGHSDRGVYDAWQLLTSEKVGCWARRTRIGGRNSLERRMATGRWNDRAEFDLQPLTDSPIDPAVRAAHVPQALAVFGELLQHAQQLLDGAQAELDGLHAPTGHVPDWNDQTRRAQFRQATRRTLRAATTPDAAAMIARNICRPHPVSKGECVSSCSWWGLRFSPPIMIHSRQCRAGRPADGRRQDGASRSPTRSSSADLERYRPPPAWPRTPPSRRPRTPYETRGMSRSSHKRVRPPWTDWAYDLARDLVKRLLWLAGVRLPAVAATLGARLGPDWTAAAVLAWLTRARARPLLDDPDDPLAYLAATLDQALTAEDLVPPHPARAHTEHRRQLAAAAAAARHAEQAQTRATYDARDAAAAAARDAGDTGGLAAFRAARAALPRRTQPRRPALPDQRPLDDCDWPTPAQPGGGVTHLRAATPPSEAQDSAESGRE